jgi:opacity protein-like surface antigen
MRKLIGAFALAVSAAWTSPAAAQDLPPPQVREPYHWVSGPSTTTTEKILPETGWYVGGEFGAMIVEDSDVDIGAVDNAIRLNYNYGHDAGIFVGYDLGGFRIEAEAAYKKADLDSFSTTIRLPGEGVVFPTSRPYAGGSETALSFMVNGMLDFGDEKEVGDISGFVGGGVGMARVKANNQRVFANTAPFLDDSDSKLAWQVFAGVRQRVTDNIDVTVKYRFFNVDDVRMTAFNGNESEHRFRSHSLLGGITFRFGGGTKTTTIPGPRQCVPGGPNDTMDEGCPDQKRCYPGGPLVSMDTDCGPTTKPCLEGFTRDEQDRCVSIPLALHFGFAKHRLGEMSGKDTPLDKQFIVSNNESVERILNEVLGYYREHSELQIEVVGHADRSGPDTINDPLSCNRARTVRDRLVAMGIPADRIIIDGRGERQNKVETENGVREVQNRRAVITFGGPFASSGFCEGQPAAY